MKLKVFLSSEFENTHEREIFSKFSQELFKSWETNATGYLLGGVCINGVEIDAILFKSDGIVIIDFKNFAGGLIFSENGPWKHESNTDIKGGSSINPFQQIKKNKQRLFQFLETNQNIFINNCPAWKFIKGAIVFHHEVKVQNENNISPSISPWFKILSFKDSFAYMNNVATPGINLSDEELERLKNVIGTFTEIKPDEIDKHSIVDEKKATALLMLYLAVKKKETYELFNEIPDKSYPFSKDGIGYEVKTNDKGRQRLKKQLADKLLEEVRIALNDIQGFDFFNLTEIDKYNSVQVLELVNSYSKDRYSEKKFNLPDLIQNDLIKFSVNLLFDFGKYNEVVHDNLILYFLNKSDKKTLVPLLFSLYKLVNEYYSYSTIITETNWHDAGFKQEFIEQLILNFSSDCDIPSYEMKIVTRKSRHSVKFCNAFRVPKDLVSLQVEILQAIKKCFKNPDDFFLFYKFLGLEFLNKYELKLEEFSLYDSINSHIFNLSGHFNLGLTLDFPNHSFKLYHLAFYDKFLLKHKQSEYFISNELVNSKSALDDKLDSVLNHWRNNKDKIRFYPDWFFEEYQEEYRKHFGKKDYGFTFDVVFSKAIELSRNKPIDDYIDQQYPYCIFFISRYLYDKLYKHFLVERIKRMIEDRNSKEAEKDAKTGNSISPQNTNLVNPKISKPFPPSNSVLSSEPTIKKEKKVDLIGYEDVKEVIRDHVETYLDTALKELLDENNPDGILLYGPPGCGKTLFAKWIAQELKYDYYELPRSKFGSIYHDGAMSELIRIIDELNTKTNQVIFFDEFDSIAEKRDKENVHSESKKVVNTLLPEIIKLTEKGNLIVAATNYINNIDDAVLRSGRFGLKIPIFPPNFSERSLILENLVIPSLKNESIPYVQAFTSSIDNFWSLLTVDLLLYSNADLELLAKKIKRYVVKSYKQNTDLNINDINELKNTIRTSGCKPNMDFLAEVEENYIERFKSRIDSFKEELQLKGCFKDSGKSRTPIGYK